MVGLLSMGHREKQEKFLVLTLSTGLCISSCGYFSRCVRSRRLSSGGFSRLRLPTLALRKVFGTPSVYMAMIAAVPLGIIFRRL